MSIPGLLTCVLIGAAMWVLIYIGAAFIVRAWTAAVAF